MTGKHLTAEDALSLSIRVAHASGLAPDRQDDAVGEAMLNLSTQATTRPPGTLWPESHVVRATKFACIHQYRDVLHPQRYLSEPGMAYLEAPQEQEEERPVDTAVVDAAIIARIGAARAAPVIRALAAKGYEIPTTAPRVRHRVWRGGKRLTKAEIGKNARNFP